ncbi:FAD-dependent monooxygenase [Rhizobium sp. WYJ-E13]|uniref:FAD-dependent monooxygenase n=1 Tax=Rhizobium sp. WYJ-E13 TaxID=2849093 RepID=UPI001C1F1517|nr:FAD-dependent monooxygenase [Rhizobium sp. WYJ-E13]QWW72532.1 FAD-dependent monooxygenase [Rhizobium sp. WYJ-E13]
MQKEKVVIVGAGLGGIALAIALRQKGFHVDVYEQAPALGEIGAGIQVSPNACRVLTALGAFDEVKALSASPTEYRFRLFEDGEILQNIPLGDSFLERHGFPYLTIHRADLHRALTNRLTAIAPGALHLNAKATGFTSSAQAVTVEFEGGHVAVGDLVVGADGIKSVIRRQILGLTPATYTGDQAWRVMVDANLLPEKFRPDTVDIWVGPGRHAVIYPLRGGEIINFVGLVEDDSWEDESWAAKRPWEDLKKDFSGWSDEIQAIIDVANRDECYRWALNIRQPVRGWCSQRAVLLGDSAHATLPYMAQGAAMALEDAIVLARALDAGGDIADRLHAFEADRFDRTSRVVLESTANRTMFHLPTAEQLREAFMGRNVGAERNAWLYSYDATNAPRAAASPEPAE